MPNPTINIQQQELIVEGFTDSGKERYNRTIIDYSDELFEKSLHFGDADKATNHTREVTHEHVKSAAYSIAKSFGKSKKSFWLVLAQIGQYIAVGFIGYFSSQLNDKSGIPGFAISFSIGAILFIIEKLKTN